MRFRGARWRGLIFPGFGIVVLLICALGGNHKAAAAGKTEVQVFAASVMTESFGEIKRLFEKTHPEVDVKLSFAATSVLRFQVEQGSTPEVFESADAKNMEALVKKGFIATKPLPIAHNRIAVIIPAANPGKIRSLADLARPNLALVGCAADVPVGAYTLEVLGKLDKSGKFGKDFGKRVKANFHSLEPNVKGIVAKVMLGDADAGFCYVSDLNANVAKKVRIIPIPDKYNVLASHYIGIVKGCPNAKLGRQFITTVLSPTGQAILQRNGLIPVKPVRKVVGAK